ncbi:hypothetical protein GMDG_00526 [Pseudogymnoascus destructans 20631-21]|uniref:NADP-dependent oxidoreductase domain-containing protein n=1 Tax=Pseudogymnoascus destructans (strain ATCC MYA-4855 / 20631-21) TaxID=658429 RepID=L8G5Q3_PSED2|nr:hypothetical protein GMDG_00526 [Pseudogymnoascus destructans 20631-21]
MRNLLELEALAYLRVNTSLAYSEHYPREALSAVRHIDTAFAYQNETEVGVGIKASGVPRGQVWLTTKLDNSWHKRVAEGIDASLENLGTDYVDLYLIHWPCRTNPNMKEVYSDWDYVDTTSVSSPKLVAYNTSKGIHSTAYSYLGSTTSPLHKDATLLELAEKKGRSPQQVMFVWNITKGRSVIPKSVTADRIQANYEIDGLELTEEDIKVIDSMQGRDGSFLPQNYEKVFYHDDE